MSKTQKNAEEKCKAIVLAAKDLFLDQGYAVTSMDTIAQTSGVTKQTVYRYYPSKEDLFAAVMQNIRKSEYTSYQFSNSSLEEELFLYGSQLLAFHLQSETLGLYRLMITEGSQNHNLLHTFRSNGPRNFLEPLCHFLKTYCSSHNDADFTANMFCNMILSPRNGILMGHSPTFGKTKQNRHVRRVVEFTLIALRK